MSREQEWFKKKLEMTLQFNDEKVAGYYRCYRTG